MQRPIGYVDFEKEDGFMLLAIFFGLQVFILWNSCLCWQAGSVGLDMVNDAKSIITAKSGNLSQEAVRLESIPLSGTGKVPYYSKRFRSVCNMLMATMVGVSIATIAHEYLKSDFMDKALTAQYDEPYLNWRQTY